MQIPIVRLALGDAEIEAAARVIRSGWVAQGPEVAAFEREFAAAVGAPWAVAVSSCTVALELCLRVAGVRPGDDVATVSHSFIATANAVVAVGARPIFVDVQADTYNMDPARSHAPSPRARGPSCACTRWAFPAICPPSWPSLGRAACRSSKTPPAPSAARSASTATGSASAGPTACWPVSRSTRAS